MSMRHLGQAANFQPLGLPIPIPEYIELVREIRQSSLILFLPLNETAGTIARNAQGVAARNGTYTSVALNSKLGIQNYPAPLFDGATSFVDIYSASLNAAWNGNVSQICGWSQVSGAGVWTDGAVREIFAISSIGNPDFIIFRKNNANNQLRVLLKRNNVTGSQVQAFSDTGWFWWSVEISAAGVTVYVRPLGGAEINFSAANVQSWSANLLSTRTCIGALTDTPTNVFAGFEQFFSIWAGVNLTADERAELALA